MSIYEDIKDRIEYAKRSYPYHTREMLYEQKGRMDMAARLGAITHTEHMELNKMCVAV